MIRSSSYELYGCVCEYCDKLFSLGDKCFNKYNNCTKTTFAIHVFQRGKFFIILKLNLCGCNNFILSNQGKTFIETRSED